MLPSLNKGDSCPKTSEQSQRNTTLSSKMSLLAASVILTFFRQNAPGLAAGRLHFSFGQGVMLK
jgi:hypothetical protein